MTDTQYSELIDRYIRYIENPDSIGWDEATHRWYAPLHPQYDKNQRGFGLDVNTNSFVVEYLRKNPRPGNYLTEQEEQMIRQQKLDELNGVYNRRVPSDKYHFSDKKRAIAFGLMYHGYGPKLWNRGNDGIYDTFWNGDDEAFQAAVSHFYAGRNSERQRLHDEFWKKEAAPAPRRPKLIPRNRPIPAIPPALPDALRVAPKITLIPRLR